MQFQSVHHSGGLISARINYDAMLHYVAKRLPTLISWMRQFVAWNSYRASEELI